MSEMLAYRIVTRVHLLAAAWLVCGVVACTPPVRQFDLHDQPVSCDEANRYSFEALKALNFKVEKFEAAAPGRPGILKGNRNDPLQGNQNVTVTIDCRSSGANIDANEDGKLLGQIDFKRGFHMSFNSVRSMAASKREMAAKIAAGKASASQQRKDVQILVEPLKGSDSKMDFDFDLAAAGVLPVKVQLGNLTGRDYALDPDEIRLTRTDRERVQALSLDEAVSRLMSARLSTGEPVTALGRDVVAQRLGEKMFRAKQLQAQSDARGFLYFPLADYLRARVVLTEEESGETEGFVVEF